MPENLNINVGSIAKECKVLIDGKWRSVIVTQADLQSSMDNLLEISIQGYLSDPDPEPEPKVNSVDWANQPQKMLDQIRALPRDQTIEARARYGKTNQIRRQVIEEALAVGTSDLAETAEVEWEEQTFDPKKESPGFQPINWIKGVAVSVVMSAIGGAIYHAALNWKWFEYLWSLI